MVVVEVKGETVRLDPTAGVIVPTGGGTRFHRPDGPGYETACKTEFQQPVVTMTVAEALQDGYTPCRKQRCYHGQQQRS